MKTLTMATAVYRSFDETYFTLEALRTYHPGNYDILVVDNAPEPCRRTQATVRAVKGMYVHRPDLHGTSAPRDACFHLAKTPWVMVIDNHVLLEPGAVAAATAYAEANPDSKDIVSGPLVGDDGVWSASHWKPDPSGGLWGTWASPKDMGLPVDRLGNPLPFEIPMQGLGLWMMRAAVWPGFNPLFRGFGGEEGYIHERVRRAGGKAICLPALRWRHKFRDIGKSGASKATYPLRSTDHAWNLLVGHRELGLAKDEAILASFIDKETGRPRLGKDVFDKLVTEADSAQPVGLIRLSPRRKVLGVWYSNNAAPAKLIQQSLQTIKRVKDQSSHDVTVVTCPWEKIPGNPFPEVLAARKERSHRGIINQINQCVAAAGDGPWDAVVFLEHDVIYAPGHVDRLMKAFELKPEAQVAWNQDYEGLNATGWLSVERRHSPLHQLAMRPKYAAANFERALADWEKNGSAVVEPQGDRTTWAAVPPEGLAPNVHVNYEAGPDGRRFTTHGEVVYQAASADKTGKPRTTHPFWGDASKWWPVAGESPEKTGGCGCSARKKAKAASAVTGTVKAPPTPIVPLPQWYAEEVAKPTAAAPHLEAVRALAATCHHATEVGPTNGPFAVAIAHGLPQDGKLLSISDKPKPWWPKMTRRLGERFEGVAPTADHEETDLLLIDGPKTAPRVYASLNEFRSRVGRYILIPGTAKYGYKAEEEGQPGLLAGILRFLRENSGWVVKDYHEAGEGLTVLSKDPAEKMAIEHGVKDAFKFFKASLTQALTGNTYLPLEMANERIDACLACPQRGGTDGDRCRICHCALFQVPEHVPVKGGGPGKVFYPSETCPINRWTPRPKDGVKMTGAQAAEMLNEAFGETKGRT